MNYKSLQIITIFFLNIFLFGSFIEGFTTIKYIGLYAAILFYLIDIIKNKNFLYKNYLLANKLSFTLLFLFLLTVVISILFSDFSYKEGFRDFRVSFLNSLIFMIICINVKDKKLLLKYFTIFIVAAFAYDTFRYLVDYIKVNPRLDLSIRLERNYSDYFILLYPFVLYTIFIIKNKLRYFLIALLLVAFVELILTGARGAWVSSFIETLLLFTMMAFFKREYIVRFITGGILFAILFGSGGYFIYNHSSLIQEKLKQGISPNGRVNIVKNRLPIFLKHGNLLVGVGGPNNFQYDAFLNKYKASTVYAKKISKDKFRYNSDGPFLLQIFYKEGIIGLITFLLLVFNLFYIGYKYKNMYLLSTLISFAGYYLVRGLVENREFKYLIILFIIILIAKIKNENSLHIS